MRQKNYTNGHITPLPSDQDAKQEKNWPMMYTWILKNAIDVAVGFRVLGLIRNKIFLDKAYELSTYLSW